MFKNHRGHRVLRVDLKKQIYLLKLQRSVSYLLKVKYLIYLSFQIFKIFKKSLCLCVSVSSVVNLSSQISLFQDRIRIFVNISFIIAQQNMITIPAVN